MFDALAERLESAWKTLRGQDKISESNVQEALREVRRALLEADVNLQVQPRPSPEGPGPTPRVAPQGGSGRCPAAR